MKNLGTAGYKLLTPGPLTTTETVKEVMLFDHCTWDDDYKEITQKIRRDLLKLAQVEETEYTTAGIGFIRCGERAWKCSSKRRMCPAFEQWSIWRTCCKNVQLL